MNERLRAQNDYLTYSQNRETKGLEIKRGSTNFDTTYRCRDTACVSRCEDSQRQCHTTCGGEVTAKTECTAFCGK
ncbi:MAG: hypothetical protein LW855_07170 [Alphaproteobacteria bacterium]|jgi:hypothetical protein|nr:hypothetical protein [Alphaproteobacteria bacterium]